MGMGSNGGVKQMRTPIRLLAAPKSMHSIIDATQREQRHGSAGNCLVSRSGVPVPPYSQPDPTPSLCSVLSGPEWPRAGKQPPNRMSNQTCLQRCAGVRSPVGNCVYGQYCGGACGG